MLTSNSRWSEEPKVAAAKTGEFEEMKALQKAFFLDLLLVDPKTMSPEHLALMDKCLKLSQSGNVEVELNWFLLAVKQKYSAAYPEIRRFLGQHGRMKYNRPIYQYHRVSTKMIVGR
jgi:hypothetical protein